MFGLFLARKSGLKTAQEIDRGKIALRRFIVPEGPAIAGRLFHDMGAQPVDGARGIAGGQAAIDTDAGMMALLGRPETVAGLQPAILDQRAEWHAGQGLGALLGFQRIDQGGSPGATGPRPDLLQER